MIKRLWHKFSEHDRLMLTIVLSALLFVSLKAIATYYPNGYVSIYLLGDEYS